MFNKINHWLRTAATLGATAAALVACGGGGEGLPINNTGTPPDACTASSDCAVSIKSATAFQYDTGATDAAVASNASDYTLTGTRTAAAKAWGTVVAQLQLSAAQDVSSYKSLKISLASTSNTAVTLMLGSSGAAKVNPCYPSYTVEGLTGTAQTFTIKLTDFAMAKNPDAKCSTVPYADPDTAVAVKSVTEIQVRETKGDTGTNAVRVVIGKPMQWSMEEPVTPPPQLPPCSSTTNGNVGICTTGAFQYGTGAAAGAVATNANDYTLTGTRTDTSDAGSTVAGQLNLYAAQDVSSYKSLKLSLASTSNSEVTLMLMSSGAKKECYPTFKVTKLAPTAQNFTIALTDFKLENNPDQGKCGPDKTTDPNTPDALKNVTGIQVRERKGAAGTNTVNVVIGKPMQWSMELPVVEPPTPTTTPVVVDYTYAGGFGPAGDTTKQVSDGGTTTFTTGGAAPWVLAGSRVAITANWSTALGVLHVNAQPTGAKNKTSLGFTLASGGNTEILIRLKASDYKEGACTPTYKSTLPTTGATAFTVALSDFKSSNDSTATCTSEKATAEDLANFDKIEITDRMETTGKTTINVTLSTLNWVVAP